MYQQYDWKSYVGLFLGGWVAKKISNKLVSSELLIQTYIYMCFSHIIGTYWETNIKIQHWWWGKGFGVNYKPPFAESAIKWGIVETTVGIYSPGRRCHG